MTEYLLWVVFLPLVVWWLKKSLSWSGAEQKLALLSAKDRHHERKLDEHDRTLQAVRVELEVLSGRFSERTTAINTRLSTIAAAVTRIEQLLLKRGVKR